MSPKKYPELSPEALELMGKIRTRYLDSGDFNGLHIHGELVEPTRQPAVELVEAGLVQVVTGADYMNIHIRPWPSLRATTDQIRDMRNLSATDYGVCLYPTPAGMKGVRLPSRITGRPYAKEMARGKGTLELAYFQFDVLEQYRNDSRFRFSFSDSGASMGITDDAFDDEDVFERDHVGLNYIGFAYDLSAYDREDPESPIFRRVAVFYCDLVTLTPEHQRRWETYQVDGTNLEPHPRWWKAMMGHWENVVGPIEKLFIELENLNDLADLSFGEPLFRATERPEDMGWLLRPDQREWDDFMLQLDKVLSDNLHSDFFNAAGIPAADEDGRPIGTLNRLQQFMQTYGVEEEQARKVLGPLREVRKARQRPAHKIRDNLTDKTYIHRQIELLSNVDAALVGIRGWLSTHPKCKGWEPKYGDVDVYML